MKQTAPRKRKKKKRIDFIQLSKFITTNPSKIPQRPSREGFKRFPRTSDSLFHVAIPLCTPLFFLRAGESPISGPSPQRSIFPSFPPCPVWALSLRCSRTLVPFMFRSLIHPSRKQRRARKGLAAKPSLGRGPEVSSPLAGKEKRKGGARMRDSC